MNETLSARLRINEWVKQRDIDGTSSLYNAALIHLIPYGLKIKAYGKSEGGGEGWDGLPTEATLVLFQKARQAGMGFDLVAAAIAASVKSSAVAIHADRNYTSDFNKIYRSVWTKETMQSIADVLGLGPLGRFNYNDV